MADIIFETTGPIARLTFNKPDKANALDPAWLPSIAEFLDDVDADPEVRCVLLRANGKHFMAGGDLGTVERGNEAPAAPQSCAGLCKIHLKSALKSARRSRNPTRYRRSSRRNRRGYFQARLAERDVIGEGHRGSSFSFLRLFSTASAHRPDRRSRP